MSRHWQKRMWSNPVTGDVGHSTCCWRCWGEKRAPPLLIAQVFTTSPFTDGNTEAPNEEVARPRKGPAPGMPRPFLSTARARRSHFNPNRDTPRPEPRSGNRPEKWSHICPPPSRARLSSLVLSKASEGERGGEARVLAATGETRLRTAEMSHGHGRVAADVPVCVTKPQQAVE